MIDEISKKLSQKISRVSGWLENVLEKPTLSDFASANPQSQSSSSAPSLESNSRSPSQNDLQRRSLSQIQSRTFEVTTDLSQLTAWADGLPLQEGPRIEFLFTRLIPYFDAGILFKRLDSEWGSIGAFQAGQFFSMPEANPLLRFCFPERPLTEVMRAHSQVIISELKSFEFMTGDEDCLALRIHPDYYFLVLTRLPELFQKLHVEQIHTRLLALACDLNLHEQRPTL